MNVFATIFMTIFIIGLVCITADMILNKDKPMDDDQFFDRF